MLVDCDGGEEDPLAGRTPVTLLTGALGAGKTTLIRHILEAEHGYRVAVIQNEFSEEMGIEAPLITDAAGETFKDIYELPNGCLCCSAKDSLIGTLDALLEERSRFDYVLVEATGVADPEALCEIFWVDDELGSRVYLDSVVTLVDGHSALAALGHEDDGVGGARQLGLQLEAAKQIVCADILLLNKADLLSDEACRARVVACLVGMNPVARLLVCARAVVPLGAILGVRAFGQRRLVEALRGLGLERESSDGHVHGHDHGHGHGDNRGHDHASCAECIDRGHGGDAFGHGIDSCLLKGPVTALYEPGLVRSWLAAVLWEGVAGGVYRCKGLFRGLCDDDDDDVEAMRCAPGQPIAYALQGVGKLFEVESAPRAHVVESKFLFIGRGLRRDVLESGLHGCLLSTNV
eukprot:NODE_9761_length_1401_cov_4.528257.p1 GENE.NODE_9761_length_1401_cov_4.528257~~NODE_9761_length_1401_cov_4.528257.p1  ORF type:complete len:406 (-),score=118.72 NODE_9761_length_1401_cov_4.528257:131-1348(-)